MEHLSHRQCACGSKNLKKLNIFFVPYLTQAEEALTDKRGCHKTDDEVDELELLRRENARLKRKLEEKDMLAGLLKKVQESERM